MSEGRKDDNGKARFDLIPPWPLYQLAELFGQGAEKYADRNWELGIKWGRIFAAMMRHAWKWWGGEEHDGEDGQHHLTSVAWCAFVLLEYIETHPELDDRPLVDKEDTSSFPSMPFQPLDHRHVFTPPTKLFKPEPIWKHLLRYIPPERVAMYIWHLEQPSVLHKAGTEQHKQNLIKEIVRIVQDDWYTEVIENLNYHLERKECTTRVPVKEEKGVEDLPRTFD